jgi:hypothetical protein
VGTKGYEWRRDAMEGNEKMRELTKSWREEMNVEYSRREETRGYGRVKTRVEETRSTRGNVQ